MRESREQSRAANECEAGRGEALLCGWLAGAVDGVRRLDGRERGWMSDWSKTDLILIRRAYPGVR